MPVLGWWLTCETLANGFKVWLGLGNYTTVGAERRGQCRRCGCEGWGVQLALQCDVERDWASRGRGGRVENTAEKSARLWGHLCCVCQELADNARD
jgi:hypothetical protein